MLGLNFWFLTLDKPSTRCANIQPSMAVANDAMMTLPSFYVRHNEIAVRALTVKTDFDCSGAGSKQAGTAPQTANAAAGLPGN